jgi:arginine-tRNA-protein transferase
MKIFKSESLVDYGSYTFNYAIYCIKESQKEIPEIYNQGFLPYSNNINLDHETYYMARSLRVELVNFKTSSENRRVSKKIDPLNPQINIISIDNFDVNAPDFQNFCMKFATKRFTAEISKERLNYILNAKSISHIFEFTLEGKKVGYVITIIENGTLHYWFAFFSLEYQEFSLGKYLMQSVIHWAAENNLDYVYLGSCYGEKSLYKVRDFKGLAFFNGNKWNKDIKLLKAKCKTDSDFIDDDFKQDTDLFIKNLAL